MWCNTCNVNYPYHENSKCPSCGTTPRLSADDILGDSPARIVSEIRTPQVQMAAKVEAAIALSTHLVAEAGTGTGKSFALLVPAILSGKRIVVSTATTLLQHQYSHKDLEFLANELGDRNIDVTFAVAKGKSHYACRREFARIRKQLTAKKEEVEQFDNWLNQSDTGDKLELGTDVPKFFQDVSAEECVGAQYCSWASDCGYAKARARIKDAQVIVANHSVVGFDIKLGGGKLLPEHSVYIVDEAHQAEDYFRSALSYELRESTIANLSRKLLNSGAMPPEDQIDTLFQNLQSESDNMFASLRGLALGDAKIVISPEKITTYVDNMIDIVDLLITPLRVNLNKINQQMEPDYHADQGAMELALKKLTRFGVTLRSLKGTTENNVLYLEANRSKKKGLFLKLVLSPVFIGSILSGALYPRVKTVIYTSATLAVGTDFSFFKSKMGLPVDTPEYLALSPFDHAYAKRTVLYLPAHLPVKTSDNAEEYYNIVGEEVSRLIKISKGCAFVLCASRGDMDELYNRVREDVDYPIMIQQPDVSTGAAESWFRGETNPVLFGLKSFWEGISIEGNQLRMVIIPRVPFPVPTDPIFKAQCDALEKEGKSSFMTLSLPSMITDVKQGSGRLIRTVNDFGCVALLDTRIAPRTRHTKRYANQLLNSLPFMVKTDKLDLVRQAMECFL